MKILLLFLIIYSVAIWMMLLISRKLILQIYCDRKNWKGHLNTLLGVYGILILIGWVFFIIECYKFCSKIIVKENI